MSRELERGKGMGDLLPQPFFPFHFLDHKELFTFRDKAFHQQNFWLARKCVLVERLREVLGRINILLFISTLGLVPFAQHHGQDMDSRGVDGEGRKFRFFLQSGGLLLS